MNRQGSLELHLESPRQDSSLQDWPLRPLSLEGKIWALSCSLLVTLGMGQEARRGSLQNRLGCGAWPSVLWLQGEEPFAKGRASGPQAEPPSRVSGRWVNPKLALLQLPQFPLWASRHLGGDERPVPSGSHAWMVRLLPSPGPAAFWKQKHVKTQAGRVQERRVPRCQGEQSAPSAS